MKLTLVMALFSLAVLQACRAADFARTNPKESIHQATRSRLLLNLIDGSRVIGTTDLVMVPIHSENIGDLQVPLKKIVALKFSADHKRVIVMLINGDRLDGSIAIPTIGVTTVFGTVHVPLEQLRDIQIGANVSGFAIQMRAANRNYIEVPASEDFDVTASWTLEFWANLSGGKGENLSPVMRGADDCITDAGFSMDVTAGYDHAQFFAGGSGGAATAKVNILDSQWHHWAGVVNNGQISFYIDGTRIATHRFVATDSGSPCPVRFGYRATHGGCYIDGAMAEIRISRVARYTTDFSPTTSYALDGDTLAYWRFKEGQGDVVHDETGKHDGRLRGSPPPLWTDGVTPVAH